MIPVIFGLSGVSLTSYERDFFTDCDPAGYILFSRNIVNRSQLRRLTAALRDLHGRERLAILIDQEGGRVARMTAPEWPLYPAAKRFDELFERAPASAIEAVRLNAIALAVMLGEVGITVNSIPVLDVRQPGAHDVIGDRALGSEPMRVAALGRAVLDGLQRGGVLGIVKHVPGHGRAMQDSHKSLPVIDASDQQLQQCDLVPFAVLNKAAIAMTCHAIFSAWDSERPATLSPVIINNIVRSRLGYDGLLLTDDLDMQALDGDIPSRAVRAIAAGCDLALNCWGKMDDMTAIADRLGAINAISRARLDKALERIVSPPNMFDLDALIARREALLARVHSE